MAATQPEINSLIIPLAGQKMVVPQSGLAEVISREEAKPLEGGAHWLRGTINWRGQQIPVISLEQLCGRDAAQVSKDSRFIVLYAVERLPGLNYFAVEVSGIPHPLRLHDGNLLKGGSQDSACMAVAMNVLAEGEEAVMLNAPYIEQQISEQLQRL